MKLFRIPKEPKSYLDVIKLMAIGMVVFNHSGNNGYKMYLDVTDAPWHQLILCWSAFIKIAVPLFFMASGALLLRKEESYGKLLVGRVLKFTMILLAVSFFFYYEAHAGEGQMSLGDFLIHVYRNDLSGHLWYLYSYLCCLMMLPLLRKLAHGMRRQDYLLLIIVFQLAQLLPAADYAIFRGSAAHTGYLSFFAAENYVVYPLLGYFIDNLEEKDDREETIYILLFLSIVSIYLTSVLMDWRYQLDGGWTNANREAYMGSLALMPAITVFYAIRKLFARPLKRPLSATLFLLGSCTFGVYLLDPKWRQLTQSVRMNLAPSIGLYAATHVQTLCAVLLGIAATLMFKCIMGAAGALVRSVLPTKRDEES